MKVAASNLRSKRADRVHGGIVSPRSPLLRDCPRCGVTAGWPCVRANGNPRSVGIDPDGARTTRLKAVHAERRQHRSAVAA